jgi:hypothetical protein
MLKGEFMYDTQARNKEKIPLSKHAVTNNVTIPNKNGI